MEGPGRGAWRWRGPLSSWVRAGLPRRWRSAPVPCPGAFWLCRSRRRTNRTSARLWCAYRAHPRCFGGPNTTGGAGFLKCGNKKSPPDLGTRSHPKRRNPPFVKDMSPAIRFLYIHTRTPPTLGARASRCFFPHRTERNAARRFIVLS